MQGTFLVRVSRILMPDHLRGLWPSSLLVPEEQSQVARERSRAGVHMICRCLTRLLPVGHLPVAALLKTLWLFSLSSPCIPFGPLTSQTSSVFPDGQRCVKYTQRMVLTRGSCRNHDLTIAWGSTYLNESPSSTSTASPLAVARLPCGGLCAAQPQASARTHTSHGPSGWGRMAVSVLPHRAGWVLGQERCW